MSSMHLSQLRRWLLQSPPIEWANLQLRSLLIGALSQGPIPQHIAIVMDGNRRFARSKQIEVVEGHNLGFEAMAQTLEICYRCGVKVVTMYAFSIENFKRSVYEVDALMAMAKLKLNQLSEHGELFERYGASVRVLGRREMLKPDVIEAIDHAVAVTANNKDAILNICFPYTSRDEMTHAVQAVVDEYSRPLPPPPPSTDAARNPMFTHTHIEQNIRSRHLSAASTVLGTNAPAPDGPEPRVPSPNPSSGGPAYWSDAEDSTAFSSSAASPPQPSTPPDVPFVNAKAHLATATKEISATSYKSNLHPRFLGPESNKRTKSNQENLQRRQHQQQQQQQRQQKQRPPQARYPDPETIDESTLDSHMFTAGMPPVDLLIRTSGVERLSDFLLWQVHENTEIVFLRCMWPEFDLWHFLPILIEWQWKRRKEAKEERWAAAKRKPSSRYASRSQSSSEKAEAEVEAETDAEASLALNHAKLA